MSEKQKALTLSIIIPVYNEEDYLADCLDSIAMQTVAPLEVIVIDNNSSDSTADIARRYDFVRIVHEARQHQSYAQHSGFAAARGDIIGRIDADTILPAWWVKKTLKEFMDDPEVLGVTGSGTAYDVVLRHFGRFMHRQYYKIANAFAGHMLMWGSNCAFRRSAWPKIENELLLRPDIWEDYDLGFCLGRHGKIKSMDNDVMISYRSIHKSPASQLKYHFRSVRTFSQHRGRLVTAAFGIVWSSILLLGPVVAFDYYILRPIKGISLVRTLLSRLGYLIDI